MLDDSWKDESASDDQTKDHARMMVRVLKIYMEEFEKVGFTRAEAIDIGTKIVIATLAFGGK